MTRVLSFLFLMFAAGAVAHAENAPTAADPVEARPSLVVDPRTLDFESAGVKSFVLSNTGSAPLAVKRVAAAADAYGFSVVGVAQGTLQPGQTMTVQVQYTPDAKRKQAFGGIQIFSDDDRFPVSDKDATAHVTGVEARAGNSWLLTAMIFLPLLGALVILLLPAGQDKLYRWVALATAAAPCVLAGMLYLQYDRSFGQAQGNFGLQFIHHFVWIPSFNAEYFVGIDGLSVSMMILTALVSLVAIGASFNITKQVKAYFCLFLLLETGMMGTFAAIDFFLFYIFWELMLLPMYFLIGIWGGPRKEYAAIKFFLYTLAGSVLMLLAIIALYYNSGVGVDGHSLMANPSSLTLIDGTPALHTFDMMKLGYLHNFAGAAPLLGIEFVKIVWVGLFIGFAIKIPMFPFHTWLPDAHVEAPTAISVILAGVLLKMGTYGILRINFAILPTATQWAGTTMAVFGTINILYGAFCAFAQKDLKKLVAYSSVSHMGYCLVGMAAFAAQDPAAGLAGFNGAMMQMFNHGTITSMLFILVGVLYDRAHTREIDKFGGMATQMPKYAAFFGFAFMASLGLPGLSGFIGEVLVFVGSFPAYRIITILAATGVIFTAAYHLWAMQRIQLGPWNEAVWHDKSHFPDLTMREALTLLPMAALVLLLGFYPMPLLQLINQGLADLLTHVRGASAGQLAGLP